MTDILQFTTGLAHFSLLVMDANPGAPAKHCEWPGTDFAFFPILFFGHLDVWVFSKTHLGENGKARILPVLPVVGVGTHRSHHLESVWGQWKLLSGERSD